MSKFLWIAVIIALFEQEKAKRLKKNRKEMGKKKTPHPTNILHVYV